MEPGTPIYMTCLIVKDDSTAGLDKSYKLYYYSQDQKPGDELFGGFKAANLYKDEHSREILMKYIQVITRFNMYLDLVIKKVQDGDMYQIIDGKVRSFHLEE